MQRYALGIEYCGTRFKGWQTQQAGVRSIQQTLEQVLSRIADSPVTVHGAGRTDAGVHATNMVAHFDTEAVRPLRGWLMGANAQLPKDIAIQWIVPVEDDFHARFKAIARRYRYVIYHAAVRPAALYGQVTHAYYDLDLAAMQVAARQFEGTHNFETFRAKACQSNQPIRHVSHCHLQQYGRFLVLDIQADGFLQHMVRNIVGCLLDIGQGNYSIEHIAQLFAAQDRRAAGMTAPPHGLYFVNAYYPPELKRQLPHVELGPHWLRLAH